MQCLECIEYNKKGKVNGLEKITSNCLLYQNNQCTHLTTQSETTPKFSFSAPWILLVVRITFATFIILAGSLIINHYLMEYKFLNKMSSIDSLQTTNTYNRLMEQASRLKSDVEAFELLGVQYVTFPDTYTEVQLSELKSKLLALGDNSSSVTPLELYNLIGVENAPDPQIYKVHGFVSALIDDPYYGYTAVISNTSTFEAKSINVVKPKPFNLAVGDEVIFLCVPKLINIATPITVHGWVQP